MLLIMNVKCLSPLESSSCLHLAIWEWQNWVDGLLTSMPNVLYFYNYDICDIRCISRLFWFNRYGLISWDGVNVNMLLMPRDCLHRHMFYTNRSPVAPTSISIFISVFIFYGVSNLITSMLVFLVCCLE